MEKDKLIQLNNTYGGASPKELSPLVLAYIGDGVYELLVRMHVLSYGNAPVNKMHKRSRELVKAQGQNNIYFKIEAILTEEEQSVFRRGRNAKSHTVPKNADLMDYKHATGLEALFGYLYLKGDVERALELFNLGISKDEENKIG